jgi:aminopeptidase N
MQACRDKEKEREPPWLVCDGGTVTGTAAHAIRSVSSAFVIGSQGPKRLRFHVPIHLIYIYAFSCNIHVTTIELWKRESKKWYIIITQRAQEDCRNIFRLDLYKKFSTKHSDPAHAQ